MKKHRGILIVVSGFSGAGKGTLMKQITQKHENYALSVSMTTRSPRPGEKEGKEYYFTAKEKQGWQAAIKVVQSYLHCEREKKGE